MSITHCFFQYFYFSETISLTSHCGLWFYAENGTQIIVLSEKMFNFVSFKMSKYDFILYYCDSDLLTLITQYNIWIYIIILCFWDLLHLVSGCGYMVIIEGLYTICLINNYTTSLFLSFDFLVSHLLTAKNFPITISC